MLFWTPANLQVITNGVWLARPPSNDAFRAPIDGAATDSRSLPANKVFIALKGDTFDAHDFLEAVSPAPLVIVNDESKVPAAWRTSNASAPAPTPAVLRVESTLKALQRLAAAYRRALPQLRVVGVTGSNGKTTTTRILDSVLSIKLRGSASIKSFNNHIGVPLTLLAARPSDQYVVCEMGMNHAGEIAPLTDMARPDAAVITSIGRAHIENLGSVEAIAKEKASIFAGLKDDGVAVAPADTALLADYLRRLPHVVTFGRDQIADLRLTHAEIVHDEAGEASGQRFTVNGRWTYEIPLVGEHNIFNACAAIAVARRLGLNEDEITRGLAQARPPEMRFNRLSIAGVNVINDAYNASPESVAAALRTFASLWPVGRAARRVLVLGDMLELGEHSDAAHDEIGRVIAATCPCDVLIMIGPGASRYEKAAGVNNARTLRFDSADDKSCREIAEELRAGDAVLLKASRRMGLERVVKALEQLHAGNAAAAPVVTTRPSPRPTAGAA
ncbi:MAG: UDP-N-acetylmuramoyl-tripeptide--D-alanyl-D-alanine ligase [Phycisphaerales bacterium]